MSFVCSCYLSLLVLTSSPTPAPSTYLLQQCNWAKHTLQFIEKAVQNKTKNISSLCSLSRAGKMLAIHCDTSLKALSRELSHALLTETLQALAFHLSPFWSLPAAGWCCVPHTNHSQTGKGALPYGRSCVVFCLGQILYSGPHRPHLLSHVPMNKAHHHSSNGSLWEKKGNFSFRPRQELSVTDLYTSSALAFCVRGGIFQCGGKSYSNHSFRVLWRVSLKCQKSPIK